MQHGEVPAGSLLLFDARCYSEPETPQQHCFARQLADCGSQPLAAARREVGDGPLLFSIAFMAAATFATPGFAASCSSNGTVETCSGSFVGEDVDVSDGDYTDLILEDIDDADSAKSYFVHTKNKGDEGDDHGDDGDSVDAITVTFEGGDTEIVLIDGDEEPAISLFGEGGSRQSGKDRTSSSSSGQGRDRDDGGEVTGAQILALEDGSISGDALSAATVTVEGGHRG